MSFKYALGGKLVHDTVQFENEASKSVQITGPGVGGGWKPGEYSVVGVPLARAADTVTIATAADNENYSITVRGKTYTVDSGVAATVTTIRDALGALLDADVAAGLLDATVADNSTDAIDITANVPGEALDTAVTADTPTNITLAESVDMPVGLPGVVGKKSALVELRATAAITKSVDLLIVG